VTLGITISNNEQFQWKNNPTLLIVQNRTQSSDTCQI